MNSDVLERENFLAKNVRRGRILEYFTIGWNLLEAIAAVVAGIATGSVSLLGFGFDSLIECASGLALIWRLREGDADERREKFALKLVGGSFFLLAAYIAFDAVKSLVNFDAPETSYSGMVIAILSLIVMPCLAKAKRRVAANLDSRALVADSRQTDICAYVSLILLLGLALNSLFGWWWSDSIAALIMLPIIIKEGVEAVRGETCKDCRN